MVDKKHIVTTNNQKTLRPPIIKPGERIVIENESDFPLTVYGGYGAIILEKGELLYNR